LGERIQVKRFEKGLTQQELANIVGVSKLLFNQWETDRSTPNESQLACIAGVLGMELMENPTLGAAA